MIIAVGDDYVGKDSFVVRLGEGVFIYPLIGEYVDTSADP